MIYIVLAIFILTYALLIFRKLGTRAIPIWVPMVVGAVLMVVTFSISPLEAFRSIDLRVISFLFGMLVLTAGFEKSGLIEYVVIAILRRSRSANRLLLGIVFGSGLLSALLVNDTIALLWTPIVLGIGSRLSLKANNALLMPLAFGITVGSAMTPIGNPQNLLVALNSGISRPFTAFLTTLLLPALVSLTVIYFISKAIFRKNYAELAQPSEIKLQSPSSAVTDRALARQSLFLMAGLLASFAVVEVFPKLQSYGLTLSSLAFGAGLLLLIVSSKRLILLTSLSWSILIFFAGMFVVMRAVWDSGIGVILLGALPSPSPANRVQGTGSIMLVSILLSQILSNVPFVQLYTYRMQVLGIGPGNVPLWMALAAGSTLAGNLSLLGAVSNVIIVDSTESRGAKPFSFLEFSLIGSLITVVTSLIFFAFIAFVP